MTHFRNPTLLPMLEPELIAGPSLRDLFALAYVCAMGGHNVQRREHVLAKHAYDLADALLDERERRKSP